MSAIKMQKWNPDRRRYEPYECPDDWKVCALAWSRDDLVNCACCGKELSFGDTYNSHELYDVSGMFGMVVCETCYEEERQREKERRMC